MTWIAALLPEVDGLLPAVFLVLIGALVVLVGAFAVFLIAQQFRNPGRPARPLR